MRRLIIIAITAVVFLSSGLSATILMLKTNALAGNVGLGNGYFTYQPISWQSTNKVLLNCSGTDILTSAMENKSTFINTILSYYNGSASKCNQTRNTTGAEFIIQTMRGFRPANGSPRLSASDIADWEARINNPSISLHFELTGFDYNSAYSAAKNDDIFYSTPKDSYTAIVFKDSSNNELYKLKSNCGNPIGDFPGGLPIADNAPRGNIDGATCTPSVIGWAKDDDYDGAISVHVYIDGPVGVGTGFNAGPANIYRQDLADAGLGGSHGFNYTLPSTYLDAATHTVYVYGIGVDSKGNTNGVNALIGSSGSIRFGPCYDYNLVPSVSLDQSVAESGSQVMSSPTVNNTGSTASTSATWQLSTFTILPAGAIPDGGTSALTPELFYKNGATSVGSGIQSFNRGITSLAQSGRTIPDLPVGSRLCYALSVHPYSQLTADNWRHSTPECVIIGKKPKVQVLGSDLLVGGSVITSSTLKNITGTPRMFGSWIEYGIFATGFIKGAGSGSAYASPGMDNYSTCRASQLSFANTGGSDLNCNNSTVIGNFSSAQTIPDPSISFSISSSTPSLSGSITPSSLQGIYRANGDITINASSIAKGQWVVINAPNSNITIAGNINYTNEKLQSIYDIPQLVIIGKNIIINDNVTNVDAWLVAKGSGNGVITTCSSSPPLTASICKDPLTVNGPIMAQKLVLLRTAGSGTGANSGDPAETFNLRPDAYLWSFARASSGGHIQTVYSQELPPRF